MKFSEAQEWLSRQLSTPAAYAQLVNGLNDIDFAGLLIDRLYMKDVLTDDLIQTFTFADFNLVQPEKLRALNAVIANLTIPKIELLHYIQSRGLAVEPNDMDDEYQGLFISKEPTRVHATSEQSKETFPYPIETSGGTFPEPTEQPWNTDKNEDEDEDVAEEGDPLEDQPLRKLFKLNSHNPHRHDILKNNFLFKGELKNRTLNTLSSGQLKILKNILDSLSKLPEKSEQIRGIKIDEIRKVVINKIAKQSQQQEELTLFAHPKRKTVDEGKEGEVKKSKSSNDFF